MVKRQSTRAVRYALNALFAPAKRRREPSAQGGRESVLELCRQLEARAKEEDMAPDDVNAFLQTKLVVHSGREYPLRCDPHDRSVRIHEEASAANLRADVGTLSLPGGAKAGDEAVRSFCRAFRDLLSTTRYPARRVNEVLRRRGLHAGRTGGMHDVRFKYCPEPTFEVLPSVHALDGLLGALSIF